VIQTTPTRQNPMNWISDAGDSELPTERFELTDPVKAVPSPDQPSAIAALIQLEQGLYALEIGETACQRGQVFGLQVPMIQVSAPPSGRDWCVEIINASERGETWLGHEGGTVLVKSPPGGGHLFVTAYGLAAQIVPVPNVEIRRLDRPRPDGAGFRPIAGVGEPQEIPMELVLHIERVGDRRFSGEVWAGERGKKLRVEAFSIRPTDTLVARDIEFKALGPNCRQTPWVTDAKLCGTRGQGLPLTGFAVRLVPHAGERFDVVYQGAFFESGIVGPHRNGELCIPPIANDPLEAINVRVIRRAAS
jgi:hypothetical protein